LQPIPFFTEIASAKGTGETGLRLSGVENPMHIGAPNAAPAGSDKTWRLVPCSWNVWKKDGVCINAQNQVATAKTHRVCRQWGATDCMGW
jgi:hypothetical protein